MKYVWSMDFRIITKIENAVSCIMYDGRNSINPLHGCKYIGQLSPNHCIVTVNRQKILTKMITFNQTGYIAKLQMNIERKN